MPHGRNLGRSGTLAAAWVTTALAVSLLVVPAAQDASAEPDATPGRLAGGDRIATAAEISAQTFPPGDRRTTALIARSDDFPDALAAAGLAGTVDGPVLLTRPTDIPADTRAELERLGVERVLLLGGENAIGPEVAAELAKSRTVERLAGIDRYATAAIIAETAVAEAVAAGRGAPDTVVVVRGDGFADALAAGAPAYANGWPILLTQRDALPAAAAEVLDQLRPRRAVVLGGEAAVAPAVEAELTRRDIAVERVAGATRTGTAAVLADRLVAEGWPIATAVLARGDDFADALTAAVLAGRARTPILLSQAPAELGPDTTAWLAGRCPGVRRVLAVGGTAALTEETLDEAHQARLACEPLPHPLDVSYRVEAVEGTNAEGLVDSVVATLNDARGWSLDGALRFVAADAPVQVTVRLALSQTITAADPHCVQGRSCRVGDVLWIDDGQWSAPPAGWGDRLPEYRSYLVNHLVGHWLGVPETGCGGGPAPVMSDQTAGLGGCAPEPWPGPAERDRARMRHVPTFTVAFGGDVHGEGRVREHLLRGGNPLELVSPVLAAADLAVVNLETAVGTTGSPQQGKSFTFRAPPQLLTALDAAGVDVVSLGNNHALDYGQGALLETIQRARDSGLAPIGAGGDAAQAYAPALLRVGRRTVAFVGLSRVLSPGWAAGPGRPGIASAYEAAAAEEAVRSARRQADVVVVMIHWGIELDECPDSRQLDLARRLTAAGASVVAGHHPHILQGIQRQGDALVHYSLGNFVWYHSNAPSRFTGVWTVELDGRGAKADTFVPAEIDGLGRPVPVGGAVEAQIRGDLARRSPDGSQCRF